MKLEVLVYSPLKEEEKVEGWEKDTIRYINENRQKVAKAIKKYAKSVCKYNVQSADIDDIISEILMYLYRSDDYNITKAIERSNSGSIVSLEGYVNSCIRNCVLRYYTKEYKDGKDIIRESLENDEGKELSIFDTITDEKSTEDYEYIVYDLKQICEENECNRYKYGVDIYLLWYLRLLSLRENKTNKYNEILNILGISKRDISNMAEETKKDGIMAEFAKAISYYDINEAIDIIEEYIYYPSKLNDILMG